ncbi:MAG: alkaline serine protease [Myxococcales bacterium]|nr:alkaline serine protease [Myxococcales bacterium]
MPAAHAAWPPPANDANVDYSDPANWPSDPGFASAWNYWSFVPQMWRAQVDAVTKKLGTGMHIDRAWSQTTGDPSVIVAVTDSGIDWNEGELTNRLFLNQGELPAPMGCPGADANKYDVNGDGRFNVQDYTTATGHDLPAATKICDPRVTDKNGNGILDPQDLIQVFSDGKDDDGNGYIDDISGWDFFHDDNDPLDDTRFGHGTGSTKDGMAEGGDGRGSIGTCPDCTAMMLRVGDAFVPELNTWGMAVIYATDIGASVVNISGGGGLDNPKLSNDAMEYAYQNGVTIIASNSDLDSFHHNFPNTSQHAISVHAIRFDSSSLNAAHTFFNYNTCTNYGAQLMLSIPATGCSSEAAGRSGGVTGLLYSAAIKAGLPAIDKAGVRHLTAEEVRQLYIETADNFYDPGDATDATKYPTTAPQPNGLAFARRFGYGRPNVRSAVDAILAGKLPPEVDIRSPGWFDTVYADKTPSVNIDVRLAWHGGALPAGATLDWVVEYAPGVDPTDDQYKAIGHAEMQAAEPIQVAWDVSSLTVDNPVPLASDPKFQPDDPANKHVVTLRARATIHSSNPMLEGVRGESRHAVSIYRDPSLLPGFPLDLKASGEGGPKIVDLDGDGRREIVFADTNGLVHAIRADGSELSGWPVKTDVLSLLDGAKGHAMAPGFATVDPKRWTPVGATAAIGDLDGDGKVEVVVATWFGNVWAWHADGSVVAGFPISLDRDTVPVANDAEHELQDGFFASPALVDLDGDKKLEIVDGGMDGKLYVWHGDGTRATGFPVLIRDPAGDPPQRQRIMGSPAVGDLNKDGIPDIVVGSNEDYANLGRLYAVDGKTGQFLPGWPLSVVSNHILPVVGKGVPCAPAMADIDGDGVPEILVSGIGSVLHVYDAKGKPFGPALVNQKEKYGARSNAGNPIEFMMVGSPAVGDLDNDGTPDLVEGGAGSDALLAFATGGQRHDFEHHVGVWDGKTGKFKSGFPQVIEDWQFFSHPAVADVDGDGKPEVIAPSAGYFVHAWNVDGVEAKGFPKYTGGWALSTPAVGDLDGDGKLELVQVTRNGWLYAWHTDGKAGGRIDWASYHHDLQNTGNFSTPLDQGSRASAGCGCQVGSAPTGGQGAAILLMALAGVLVQTRRRRRR